MKNMDFWTIALSNQIYLFLPIIHLRIWILVIKLMRFYTLTLEKRLIGLINEMKLAEVGVHGNILRLLNPIGMYRSQFSSITLVPSHETHLDRLLFNISINHIATCFLHSEFQISVDDIKNFPTVKSASDYRLNRFGPARSIHSR